MTFEDLKYDIDVCVFGSSRPQLIPHMWKSFNDMIIFRGNKRILWNEDFVFPEKSEEVRKIVNGYNVDSFFDRKPKIGLGPSMTDVFKKVKSKYIFYLQEDWLFERPIDLDQILWVMDKNSKINCVFFHKIEITKSVNKIAQPEYNYNRLPLCLYPGWPFLPGIWRMDKVRKHWDSSSHKPEGYFNKKLGNSQQKQNQKYCEDNIGCYIYGSQGEWRYVRHIGNDWRMADWRLENNKKSPGGRHDTETMDYPYMAPWVSYPIVETRK